MVIYHQYHLFNILVRILLVVVVWLESVGFVLSVTDNSPVYVYTHDITEHDKDSPKINQSISRLPF